MKSPLPFLFQLGRATTVWMLAALVGVPWSSALAEPVSSRQAAGAVTAWLSRSQAPLNETLGTSVRHVNSFRDKGGVILYYIVDLDPSGFVIVAGDDLIEPIIGFVANGAYDPSESTPLGALVSNDLAARIAHAQKTASVPDANGVQARAKWQGLCTKNGDPVPSPKKLTTIADVRVAPFTQTTWSQTTAGSAGTTACYNYYTPPYGDGNKNNYPAGCVATALAQLMRYYQFPTAGVGPTGFTVYSDGSPFTYYLHGGDAGGGPYVWSNMPLVPSGAPPAAQCQAIGALVADAGASVNMHYAGSGSSASLLSTKDSLVNTFRYANAVKGYGDSSGIGPGLTGMLNPNLDARLPVLLGISGAGGHAVVADGYGYDNSTLYHHLNLGWSGTDTAWYALPIIDTSAYYFNVVDDCVYNIYTNGSGEIISGRVLDQVGRPVAHATVSARRSGGGTYTTTTDTQGIYALTKLPAASSYSISVAKDGSNSATNTVATTTSADWGAYSGNYWGANFTWNMSAATIDHLSWSPLAATQNLNAAFPVTVSALNLTNGIASGFVGPVALSAFTTGFGPSATIIGNQTAGSYLTGSEMTHGYAFTPTNNVQVTAVRGYNTDKVSICVDANGALLVSQAVSASGSWTEATLAGPVTLAAGTTYRVSAHIPAGWRGYFKTASWPTSFANGTVGQNFYYSYGDVLPTTVYGTSQGPLVDLRYQVVSSNSLPVTPTSSGAFVGGVWNGNVTLGSIATNVVLKADDGAGHVATSNPFNVVDPNAAPPIVTKDPQSRTNNTGDNATFTVEATSSSTPSYFWRKNGLPITGANASSYTLTNVQLPDCSSLFACVVSNSYGARTSQTAVLTVVCTNVVVAGKPSVALNAGAEVYAVAPLPDGSVIFGGYFSNVNGVARSRLARLQPDGTLDPVWNPVPNASVFALAVSGTNLYVGGAFTYIGTYPRNYIAKLSTTGAGTADLTWDPNASDWVETLALDGTDVYAGGYFTLIGNQYRNCIAKLSAAGAGAADPSWNPNATIAGDYPTVFCLGVSGGSVYAGGYFTGIGGQTRYCVARLSSTGAGAADATWNPSANATVYALAVSGSSVYAGGGFTQIGTRNRNFIAKLSSTGSGVADATWNPNPDFGVWSLAANGLCIYAGGGFTNIGGLHRGSLAKLSALSTGAPDNAWEADCNGDVNIVISTDTALHCGGTFTQVAGQPRAGVAALTYAAPQLLSPQSRTPGQFQFTLSGERGQGFEILASTNLQNWAVLATLTNTTGSTNYVDSAPSLPRRFYRARQVQ